MGSKRQPTYPPNALKDKPMANKQQFFVKNEGQVTSVKGKPAENVKYTLKSGNVKVYFQEDRVSYTYPKKEFKATPKRPDKDSALQTTALYRMDMVLKEANEDVELEGTKQQSSHSNYLTNPGQPIRKVPHYGKLVYDEVYEGIDLVFKFDKGRLKYEFVVHENGDPSSIAMAYEGAESVEKAESGGLAVSNPFGQLEEAEPVAFQQGSPDAKIPCEFVLQDNREISFELEGEPEKPFVIDPYLEVSTFLGGGSADEAYDVEVNSEGGDQVYVAGYTGSSSFPDTTGIVGHQGGKDGFIAEFSADGSTLNWLTYYGSVSNDWITGIHVENASSTQRTIYAVGYSNVSASNKSNLPGNFVTDHGDTFNNPNIFVAKFDENGNAGNYAFIGSSGGDLSGGIHVNNDGIHIVGTHIPIDSGSFKIQSSCPISYQGGNTDGILAGFSKDLTSFNYSNYYGGSGEDWLFAIEEMQYVLVAKGHTTSSNLYNVNGYQDTLGGKDDVFLVRMQSGCFWESTYLGGGSNDGEFGQYSNGLAVDDQGYIHVTDATASDNFPTTANAYQGTHAGNKDIFYTRFDNGVSTLDYSTYIGKSGNDRGNGIIAFGPNDYLIAGQSNSNGMPLVGLAPYNRQGGQDGYLLEFENDSLKWASFYGGKDEDNIRNLANSPHQNTFFATGFTQSSDYLITNNAHQSSYGGGSEDAFLTAFAHEDTCKRPNISNLEGGEYGGEITLESNYEVNGSITMSGGKLTIQNATLFFSQCSELVIEGDADLEIKNATLLSCDPYWKGIRVKSSGSRVEIANAHIKNAEVAIDAEDPGLFKILNSDFIGNIYSIALRGHEDNNSTAKVNDNYFEQTNVGNYTFCAQDPLPHQYYRPGIFKVINIESFQRSEGDSVLNRNIQMRRNDFKITSPNYTLLQMLEVENVEVRRFELLNDWFSNNEEGIYLRDGSRVSFKLVGMDIENGSINGIEAYDSKDITFNNLTLAGHLSAFDNTGLHLQNVTNSVVRYSSLSRFKNGLVYLNSGSRNATEVDHNRLISNKFGLVVAPDVYPLNRNRSANPQTNTIQLDITCNKFFGNDVGIFGCGNLKDQGSSTTPAGNNFDDQTGSSLNTEWDILWQNPTPNGGGGDIDYYHYQTPIGFQPNSNGLNRGNNYSMNDVNPFPCGSAPCNSSAPDVSYPNPPTNQGCYGMWKRNPATSLIEKEGPSIFSVSPNPFDQKVNVNFQNSFKGTIEVINLQGQKVLKTSLNGDQKILNTSKWKPGIYLIRVIPDVGNPQTRKLLKTQ